VDVKAHSLLWAYRKACGMTWGLRPKGGPLALRLYHFAFLHPYFGGQAVTRLMPNRVQRLACLGITGAMRTTPTGAVEALTDLPPLELVIQGEAKSAAHRPLEFGNWSYLHPS
jgi:hypothetical protein